MSVVCIYFSNCLFVIGLRDLPIREECEHESAGKASCEPGSPEGLHYERGSLQEGWFSQRYRDADTVAGLQFLSYIIVLNTLIPISLYVSIEMVRIGQTILLGIDPVEGFLNVRI